MSPTYTLLTYQKPDKAVISKTTSTSKTSAMPITETIPSCATKSTRSTAVPGFHASADSQKPSKSGRRVFYMQFNNGHRVEPIQHHYCQRITYLCYQLEPYGDQKHLKGCLQNKKGRHAEILFIDEMRSLELSQEQITCYFTWSPCLDCAQKLAIFKNDHPDLDLRVYVSRLYFHWWRKYQEGLCSLWGTGMQVAVMDLPQFTDCWRNFVNPQMPFRPWKNLEKNSRCLQRWLWRIQESWGLQDFTNYFGNLQLGPSS
ncbi:DNA dC [Sigmodon hispidus]